MACEPSKPPLPTENGTGMLVLIRQLGQEFVIGGITIKILDACGRQVQIGISAPCQNRVRRQEWQDFHRSQATAQISR